MKRIREPYWNRIPADATHIGECNATGTVTHYCFYKFLSNDYFYGYDDGNPWWNKGSESKPHHQPLFTIEEMKQRIAAEKGVADTVAPTVRIIREDQISVEEFVNKYLTNIIFNDVDNCILFYCQGNPVVIIYTDTNDDYTFDRFDRKDIIRFLTEKLSKKAGNTSKQ